MGAHGSVMTPPDPLQRGEHTTRLRSCGNIECGIRRIRRQLTVGDAVENNLPRGRLGSLNSVLLRIPVQEDVQFRNLSDPPAIDFSIELNRELHSHSLASIVNSGPASNAGSFSNAILA